MQRALTSLILSAPCLVSQKVGAGEAPALQGGRAKDALMEPLRSRAVEQSTLSSPLRILAVADGGTAASDFSLRGFGTLAAARSSSDRADVVSLTLDFVFWR
ncbi:MAG: hypothetical protein Q8O25_14265 [Sulfurisoma sp.]|nr:hypothetical protein [Sulfurisoma sp.]